MSKLFSSHPSAYSSTLLLSVCVLAFFYTTKALVKLPPNETIPAVIVFGDSIVDTGNNNNLKTLIKCNFPPYGKDFQGGIPTGRFCNGKVPADLLAEELGIKELVPAYLDPTLSPGDLLTGVCFASGGSGYDPLTPKLVSVLSLSDQIKYFKEYISKLKMLVGEDTTNFILAKSLFLVVVGSDDIANTYYDLRVQKSHYDIPAYTDLMANSASDFLKELYGLGARRVAVFSAPPIGCVPSQRTLAGGIERECVDEYNQAAVLFNKKLSSRLDSLSSSLSNSKIIYIDVYNPLLDIIQNPQKYGFEVANKGCCGTGELEVAVLCNKLSSTTCSDDSSYIFWDSYHPTEKTYKALVYPLIPFTDLLVNAASNFLKVSKIKLLHRDWNVSGTSMIRIIYAIDFKTIFGHQIKKFSFILFLSIIWKELYGLGARKIAVFSAPPIGCVPSQRTLSGGIERECAEDYNQAAILFNKKLSSKLDSLSGSLSNSKIVYIDVYTPFLDLIQNPKKYVIMFGDSIVDTGNNNNLESPTKSNFPPYGRDFIGGVPTGRFSNGKVPSDFLVEELGIKELLPAYLDPNLKPEDLLTGVSFASGGCGYDPATAKLEVATPLFNQLQQFQEYKEKLKVIAGEEGTNTILSKSLFAVVASSNDIANTYFNFRIREFQFNLFTYTDLLVGSASTFLQQLYGLGARRIAVFSAPPLGCLPSTRTLAGGGSRKECVEIYNQAAQLFNSKLSAQIDSLNSNLPETELIYVDIYNPLLDLIQNFNNFGFEVVDKGCCGTGTIEASILCNQLSPHTCTNVSGYVFWDSFHPTEKTYKILVSNVIKKYSRFFS
ncbi:hypothetical protein Dsin_003752 [Dipteronia sinensis]|uniref:GDSL esterase/lipase EXL3 n=1 Tax=Dipteronia sinensis TaxID=43782 RepID=A0AAE0B8N9_9ROSI|nr:hypothetical protein Dsin_003752 [Dipteronia sinensis]